MNTRFNPTANGHLHLGHIYMALVNEYMAHSTGGQFMLRFDDNTRPMLAGLKETSWTWAHRQADALAALNIKHDKVVFQSAREEDVKMRLALSHFRDVPDHGHDGTWENAPITISEPTISPMRTRAWLTAEKVVLDHDAGIDAVIRGIDLLQEHSLYIYFCALLGYRFPKCYYLPRLMATSDDGPLSEVSKTMGNFRVLDLISSGVTARRIHLVLAESCLKDPLGPWHVDNIKARPVVAEGLL